ncbi:c6 finger domain-containing protein [Stemphylium lycopersici]|uniref:C6 finger domain-containing protein n=1 Tax=Stemphylium lycopersici TaxID=183478 RepID=A0A364MZB8_STELY|nr:c6 finger domain-containing protein [Stemphylium lycopersici]RAR07770.1 c6 finger domain-containing protein [Stemphylium lycopersici]RAR09018.1 c6 finger domain-containing protein [Stemphylium lycopersici]
MAHVESHTPAERAMPLHPPAHHAPPLPSDLKRKRSPSHEIHLPSAPLPKTAKHNHLQINYLARHLENDLPLITNDDTLPNILSLLSDYQGVLDRHESMACNLGARPLGPILIKRFERLFDGPPRVLKSHGKDGTTVTWLDVVEFARNKPEQFQLDQMSEGVRVCQFYTKQCRVQISEEDFVLISSGIPQKMIPPQPIIEDEEKELGTMEILEKNLSQICSLADQVAARTRQLNHRLKGRKQAILDRRASASPAPQIARPTSPSNVALMNGGSASVSTSAHNQAHAAGHSQPSQTSPGASGFVAVNARQHHESNGHGHSHNHGHSHGHSRGHGTSSSTRHDLLAKFHTVSDRRTSSQPPSTTPEVRRPSMGSHTASHPPTSSIPARALPKPTESPQVPQQQLARPSHPLNESELHSMMNSPVPIPNTPSNLLPAASQRASQQPEKDDGGPFKVEMVHRMESLAKGERIIPPCDRCRRLHMDCLKNLTACMGCTKKHAKCSWKEVREGELRGGYTYPPGTISNGQSETSDHESGDRASTASPSAMLSPSHHGLTPSHVSHSNGQHTPQHQSSGHHQHKEPHAQPAQQQDAPHDARLSSSRNTPPERERERNVEVQLQEAAQSSLAHANARLSGSDGKTADYPNQTMVA